jgi:putative DNA primase/helicase
MNIIANQFSTTAYLSPKHKSHIESRGLLNEWSLANCRTVSADEASVYLGYTAKSGGIFFIGVGTQFQFRPDKPWKSKEDKKAPKYRTPLGEYDAYLPQHPTNKDYWNPEKLAEHCYYINGRPYILLSEGVWKAIAGCCYGLPTIALMGISMGLTPKKNDLQGQRFLVAILERYARAGFGFIIVFDADAATNSNIIWEQRKLGRQLLKFGVPVRTITGQWEQGEEGETKGMDDFIQRKGIEAFRQMLAKSLDFKEWEATYDTDGGSGNGTGGKDKYLVSKSTTFELHCWNTLFADDWIVINDAFYQWNGRYWQLQADADVNKLLADFTRDCYEPVEVGKKFRFGTSKYLDSAFKYCRKALHKKVETSTVHFKSFANGTVDLRTGELFPHNKEHYLLSCSPCDYVAGSTLPPEFKKFLLSAYGAQQLETIRALFSMYLDPTAPYGKFAYLIGDSGSGKGVFLRTLANLVGAESSVSSNSLSELAKPEGRHQLLNNKSLFYIPDTGGYLSELKAFYELVDNGAMSGRALFSASSYQKNWNVRFAIASVEHIQTENSGDGWDRRCIPLQTLNRGAIIEDPELGRKLAPELGEIAGWALSMDKAERDRILLVPSTNPAIVALKQEGAILGDSVRGFVDRCFRPGGNSYVGADLHSWYVAYCKAHNNTPQGYNKFVHHLQRVLSNQWRASTVVREGDKIKRIPAFWGGLQVLPCFIDTAANSEEDNHNNRPHVENWICQKTLCADGGLQELTGNLTVTDITGTLPSVTRLKKAETRMVTNVTDTLPSVTPLKKAETRMVTDVTVLQGKSNQYEKTSSHEIGDDPNNTPEGGLLTDVTSVTTIVTPTFESSAQTCNNSKICNESQTSEPGTSAPEEPFAESTAQTAPSIAPRVDWNPGDRVKVSTQYPGAQEYIDERATVVKVWSDGLCRIELDREISVLEGKPTKQFNLNVRYLVSEFVADSNLNEEELELVNQMRGAIEESDPLVTDAVKKSLTKTCDKGLANRQKVWGALMASERTVFKALLAKLEAQPQPKQLPHAPAPSESVPKTLSAPIELSKREWEQPTTEAVTQGEPILTPTPEQLSVPHASEESEPELELPIFTADTEAHQLDLLPDFKPLSDSDGRFSPESEDWA